MTESVKYIKRHDAMSRAWHWSNIICAIILTITGLFLFAPFGDYIPHSVLKAGQFLHRVFGVIFVGFFIAWVVVTPQNFKHSMQHIFAKWNDEDKEFMAKFFPYLINASKYHMPKQGFVKSGQRVSDFFMYLIIFALMGTGIVLMLGTQRVPNWLFLLCRMGHDLAFMGMCMLMMFHIYLGAGIFEPYTPRAATWMLGSGYINESDALYHWGHWAEEELESGENVVLVKEGQKVADAVREQESA